MKKTLLSTIALLSLSLGAQSFSNGDISTGNTTSNGGSTAPTGYTWSELQSVGGLTNTTLGTGGIYSSTGADFKLADDFTVPAGEKWTISSVDVFLYQTGYNASTPPIDNMRMQILNNAPDTGTVVIGNMTTNVYNASASQDAKMYRIGNNNSGTTRKIWKTRANLSGELQPGTYWLEYQVHATNDGSIFFPAVTIPGVLDQSSWNAMQSNAGSWAQLADGGSGANIDFPFVITYTVTDLGTSEIRQYDSRISIYPNPTTEYFKLNLPEESLTKNTKVELYDTAGRLVKSFGLEKEYKISDLKNGIYMIKINDGKNIKVTKLIKN
ncbi:T9SS type A sorting domain-containing protein [Soonwooa purpurea]